jgi:hypothetical protein
MAEAFPLHFRTILRASKSRSQPATFRLSEPRRGYAYTQEIGTDVPVFWDVAFKFTQTEAVAFDLWFRLKIRRGVDPFTMPIRTEYGMVEHECRFMPDSLLPLREEGGCFGYSASIMARALLVPDGYVDAADLIIGLPDWATWASLLDLAVTVEMPTA